MALIGDDIELFVPGRLCLFGEHSDWAGGHRRQNPDIEKGHAIVAPTNQGNYARVKKLDKPILRFKSVLFDEELEIELNENKLLEIAKKGGAFSYIAGVAYEIVASYNQFNSHGIEINNYKSDLPIGKGVSSSASICVLIAKAFNEIYKLGYTKRRIMELGYLGEIATPSRCGKLDQACAYDQPVLITFDADKMDVEEINIGKEMYFLIVDLNRTKDTVKILSDLTEGFPWPKNKLEQAKHFYLGSLNKKIVNEVQQLLKDGDDAKMGVLMNLTQGFFDEYLKPSSPKELEAPVLHEVLSLPEIKPFIYGGKGIGSGGDGSAQLICKSREDREKVKEILKMKGFDGLELDLKPTIKKIKAVIMAGGFAKRLHPLTENKSKCLLELGGKPIIDYTIEKINEIPEIGEIIVIANDTFYNDFVKWAEDKPNIRILNDGGNDEDSKIGALTAFLNFVEQEGLDDDFFLAGADNFFNFSLKEIYEVFKKENKDLSVFYDIKNLEDAKRFGVILSENNIITNFEEKPEYPKSTIVGSCMYFFKKETLELIKKLNQQGIRRDNLGEILEYLYKITPLYAYIAPEGNIDIGTVELFKKAEEEILRKKTYGANYAGI